MAISAGGELAVDGGKARECRTVAREIQRQLPSALDDAGCHIDQFLHHRLEPPALGLVTHRCVRADEPFDAAGVFVVTLAVSVVAAYLPAHRINRIDPAIVFRA